jgi:predicted nucleotidyltransferase
VDEGKTQLPGEVIQYLQFVKRRIPSSRFLLFGSYASGKQNSESDIDLAVIAPQFGQAPLLEKLRLYKMRYEAGIFADIQPIPFGAEEFEMGKNFFIQEIKRTGIDVTVLSE